MKEELLEPKVMYILKDAFGKIYYAECVDVAEGGLVLEVDPIWVAQGIFPDKYVDTRFLEELRFKIFTIRPDQNSDTQH